MEPICRSKGRMACEMLVAPRHGSVVGRMAYDPFRGRRQGWWWQRWFRDDGGANERDARAPSTSPGRMTDSTLALTRREAMQRSERLDSQGSRRGQAGGRRGRRGGCRCSFGLAQRVHGGAYCSGSVCVFPSCAAAFRHPRVSRAASTQSIRDGTGRCALIPAYCE